MSPRAKTTAGFLALAALLMLVSVSSLVRVTQLREHSTLTDVLFIPSAKAVKRMSLGYNGLLADIYWTRAVQYFGNRHMAGAQEYDLLDPLLDITVTLTIDQSLTRYSRHEITESREAGRSGEEAQVTAAWNRHSLDAR